MHEKAVQALLQGGALGACVFLQDATVPPGKRRVCRSRVGGSPVHLGFSSVLVSLKADNEAK